MLGFTLFAVGCAMGAFVTLALASPGPWPPADPPRRTRHAAARERESWLR